MNRFAAVALALVALSGCDVLPLFDPNIARISAAQVTLEPEGAQGRRVFVRLATSFDTTDTEAAAGPYPLALATPSEVEVTTTDGEFDGDALTLEVRRCDATCATSEVLGRATVEPNGWRGTERSVTAGGIPVVLSYRKTTS